MLSRMVVLGCQTDYDGVFAAPVTFALSRSQLAPRKPLQFLNSLFPDSCCPRMDGGCGREPH